MSDPHVQISQGELSGTTEATATGAVRRFAGIPYAASPAGAGRFRPPEPAPAWDGVRAAADFGPAPFQATEGPMAGLVPGMTPDRVSEDCLTLNVWSPADAGAGAKLPVLLWFYGGAFTIGSSSLETYDGARLAAEQNVVVVSANYRVGAFGFLDLSQHGGAEIGAVANARPPRPASGCQLGQGQYRCLRR